MTQTRFKKIPFDLELAKKKIIIGLVDADLLCKGTRHPNLVLLKLAGYFRDHDIQYELVIDNDVDLDKFRFV